jgi:signal transduction histidine kinase
LLANASHELRSPLARIRMAVELMKSGDRTDASEELRKNIVELDQA